MRVLRLLKKLLPLKYHAVYKIDGQKHIAIWREWFGKRLWEERYKLR